MLIRLSSIFAHGGKRVFWTQDLKLVLAEKYRAVRMNLWAAFYPISKMRESKFNKRMTGTKNQF